MAQGALEAQLWRRSLQLLLQSSQRSLQLDEVSAVIGHDARCLGAPEALQWQISLAARGGRAVFAAGIALQLGSGGRRERPR